MCEDGIINEGGYAECSPKILWMLKERVDYDDNTPLPQWIPERLQSMQDGGRFGIGNTYQMMAYVSYGLTTPPPSGKEIWDWSAIPEIIVKDKPRAGSGDALNQIAIINAKQNPGSSKSNDSQIINAYQDQANQASIINRIKKYTPDIVFLGYGSQYKRMVDDMVCSLESVPVVDWRQKGEITTCYVGTERLYFWVYHPSYPTMRSEEFQKQYVEDIFKAWNELKGKIGKK